MYCSMRDFLMLLLIGGTGGFMSFSLFNELAEVAGIELYMLIGSAVIALVLGLIVVFTRKNGDGNVGKTITGIFLGVLSFAVANVIIMLIQSVSTLLATNGYAEIADIFAYSFTSEQFATRLILSVVIGLAIMIAFFLVSYIRSSNGHELEKKRISPTRALVYGALCMSLSFVLSYFKLFSMPLGGSITLFSMLPLMVYAAWFGPVYGFTAAFAYGILQVIQGAYIVHWVQFILDYFLAFTCLGIAAFFPRKLALGALVAGIARMLCSTVSGAVFFEAPEGWNSVWIYSLAYNGLTIGVDTILCAIVAVIPPVERMFGKVRSGIAQ